MALATQCPHCHTTFRVAHDQLKLRAGLVRCGACKQIFNGIENLLPPEEIEQANSLAPASESALPASSMPPSPAPADTATKPVEDTSPDITVTPPETPAPADASPPAPNTIPDPVPAAADVAKDDPLLRMTLMDFTHVVRSPTPPPVDAPDPVEEAIDDLQSKPWRNADSEDSRAEADELDQIEQREYEEPSFVKQGRRRQRLGRVFRWVMAICLPLLLIALAAQAAYTFRDQIAARFPQTRPVLREACRQLGCQVGLPAQIESVSIESSELQVLSVDKNTFALAALLRNRGAIAQAWPSIELTLNDANDKALARRVFMPRDYLPAAQDIARGFAPKSEQTINLYFALSQLQASGYHVYLFYP